MRLSSPQSLSHSRAEGKLLPALLLTLVLGSFLWRFTYPKIVFLSFFTDDFFYYLITARNLALHGVSTFNGIMPTNGYHPLWFLTLTLFVRFFGDAQVFFAAGLLLIWLLVCGVYRQLRGLQLTLGLTTGLELSCALYSTTFMAFLSRTGMEVSLALFFLVWLWARLARRPLEDQTFADAVLTGLLASAAILSRLDTILPITLYVFLTFAASASRRKVLTTVGAFTLGLLPVAAYVATNVIYFHTLLPVSGMAKNLKQHSIASLSTLHSLAQPGLVQLLFVWPSILLAVLFLVRRLLDKRTSFDGFKTSSGRVQLCIGLHPVLFYFVLSVTSDWPLWTWYFYPLVPLVAVLGPKALGAWPALTRPQSLLSLQAAASLFVVVICLGMARPNSIAKHMNDLAANIQSFVSSHPGRYAMGDASGTPAFLVTQPVLQLEGLMGDRAFLAHIQNRDPLLRVLAAYNVDYYVTNAATPSGDCYDVHEPSKAGPQSPTMPGHLCLAPIARFDDPPLHMVLVFDVRSAKTLLIR